jgi:transketolase
MAGNDTYRHWEKVKDLVDQYIDLILNYRQSGHPGGSRSKVHALLTLMLGGAMKWDIRNPDKRFADRFVLGAGHTIPLVYATLAVFNEALRIKYTQTGDDAYRIKKEGWALCWEDLLGFRRRGGLSGHAEMEGKTLFLKFNTGPSGHGLGAAAGQALALKRARAEGVKVFVLEGEGGLTPGATHEAANSAWGLALDNLYLLLDWNDFGIDVHPTSSNVYGSPEQWFGAHGWRTLDAGSGEDWSGLDETFAEMVNSGNPDRAPQVTWFRTRKGRGYLKYDNASHGAPHPRNSAEFWQTKKEFAERYGAEFRNVDGEAPADEAALREEFSANLKAVAEVLAADNELVDYLAGRLVELGDAVPEEIPAAVVKPGASPFEDPALYDYTAYPDELFARPGEKVANRKALARWGAWINAYGAQHYGRPLFIASSADLSASTNIAGFAEGHGDFPGYGWYERFGSADGALLPQSITEFANAALMTGMATVNLSDRPEERFDGFWGATSTYGSFSYLVYGMLRLFSQIDQDCDLKVGKALFVAGHSGPETADDSRTHFGIFAPGVSQLFPEGRAVNLHPWEHNEVPVLLGAALRLTRPSVIILHLTRPSVEIPDREALGIPSCFEAARGAYLVREADPDRPSRGTLYVQGTSAMANLLKILPELDRAQHNLKIVCVTSPQLFAMQDAEYRDKIVSEEDRFNSTLITTSAAKLMPEFTFTDIAREYAIAPDWDNRWRTGGTLEEVLEEAHLSPEWIKAGIERFAADYEKRMERLRGRLGSR